MHRVVVGTAGHIDHGKTRLIEALTGIDCDRWAEEKARGITIDLGFAHLELDDRERGALEIGFVDVPGHERFLHNALAGLGGIRVMLLVVAADEGVKPQTREHLAICSLLSIPHALVALTKRDLVDADLAELAELEVAELLEETPFAGAPILPVSSATGEGVEALRAALVELAWRAEAPAGEADPCRLPIDRAFQLRGLGAIVTGTLVSGTAASGQTLEVLPGGEAARVRSVQVHGSERPRALAGERTALQLTGVGLEGLERGQQLVEPGAYAPTHSLAARLRLLAEAPEALRGWSEVSFHVYSSEVTGRLRPLAGALEPGAEGIVEIRLARPVVATRDDRFIVRRRSPPLTLGGGEILDPAWRRRRGKALAEALGALGERRRALELWVAENGERGAETAVLATRLRTGAEALARELDELVAAGRLVAVETGRGRRWIAPAAFERVRERAKRALKDFFRQDRLARGMPKAQFLGAVLPRRAADLADVYLRFLAEEKILVVAGEHVNPPGRRAELSDEESSLSRRLLEAVEREGLTPPSPKELAERLGAKPQIAEGVQRYLVERRKLVRLSSGLVVSRAAVAKLEGDLAAWGRESFTVAEFKDRFALTRKWAIPLLEHLDSIGFTRRVGDRRQLVRAGSPATSR